MEVLVVEAFACIHHRKDRKRWAEGEFVEHGEGEVRLAREVGIDSSLRHTGVLGDLIEAGLGVALGGEELRRRLQKTLSGLLLPICSAQAPLWRL